MIRTIDHNQYQSAVKLRIIHSDDRGIWDASNTGSRTGINWSEIDSMKCRRGSYRSAQTVLELCSASGKLIEFDINVPGFADAARGLAEHLPHLPRDWSKYLPLLPGGSDLALWHRGAVSVEQSAVERIRLKPSQMHVNSGSSYPRATIAYYGATSDVATKMVVRIIPFEGGNPVAEKTWFSRGNHADVRHEQSTLEPMCDFIKSYNVKKIEILRRSGYEPHPDGIRPEEEGMDPFEIIGCPHEEGVDFPVGEYCQICRYWSRRTHHWFWRRFHRWFDW